MTNRQPTVSATARRRASPPDASQPARGNCFASDCPARAILAHVTGRWGSLVIAAVGGAGSLRFSQIRDRIDGISEKMLAQTLRELERDGLLLRTSRPVVPPHVDYELTPMGRGVVEHVIALFAYIESNVSEFVGAQRAHDAVMRPDVTVEAIRASKPVR